MSGAPMLRTVGAALRPHWGALAALGLALTAGLAALNDYGVFYDEIIEGERGSLTVDYALGRGEALLNFQDRFYGVGFEAPLEAAKRAFGIEDARGVHLTRHLLTRLLFLIGGLFAYLLARRLLGGALIPLFAMGLFLLHPLLHAHSFFNAKDIAFASMFMVALFLTHRAFKRDALWAFALAGVGAGFLMNARIAGAMLIPAVLAMRALDARAASAPERTRILLSGGVFLGAAALTLYATWPYLWGDPVGRFAQSFAYMARHPQDLVETFRGAAVWSQDVPADYIPTWLSLTTPPFALLLGSIGTAVLLRNVAARPDAALRNTRLRFWALLIAAVILPVVAVVALGSTLYGGWRQMFFLWAPFSLLGAFGLQWLLGAIALRRLRRAVCAAASAGLGAAIVSLALLHPFQHAYFNFFADRTEPEGISAQYTRHIGNWADPALRRLLDLRPTGSAALAHSQPAVRALLMLSEAEQARISLVPRPLAEFSLRPNRPDAVERTLASGSVYGSVYGSVIWAVVEEEDGAERLLAAYEQAAASGPVAQEAWDVYLNRERRMLVYVKEPCGQPAENVHFYLLVYPDDPGDLRSWEKAAGFANLSFNLYEFGAPLEGQCVAAVPLPDHEIAGIRTGQPGAGAWEAVFPFAAPEAYRAAYERATSREPDAPGVFHVYLDDAERALIYVKEPCAPSDAAPLFFLHVTPERRIDLSDERRELGFDNLDFEFSLRGMMFDGKCVASVPLPDYEIATARTGQRLNGDEIWEEEFAVGK